MPGTEALLSEEAAVIGVIDPQSVGAGATAHTGATWIKVDKFARILAIVAVGSTDRTVDASIKQASDSAGTGAKAITGKAVTQFSPTDDNKVKLINLDVSELDVEGGFEHIRLEMVSGAGGTTTLIGGLLLGGVPRYGPASDNDAAAVAEIVN